MQSPSKTILWVLIVIVLLGGAVFLFLQRGASATVFDTDTTFTGDHSIAQGTTVQVKDGAVLTVDGNLSIAGTVECVDGPITLVVTGTLHVSGTLACDRGTDAVGDLGNGISIVAEQGIEFADTSVLVTNGHVQVVDNASNLATDQEAIDALYADAGEDSGEGIRMGPFIPIDLLPEQSAGILVPDARTQPDALTREETPTRGLLEQVIPTAHARVEPATDASGNAVPGTARIGGNWVMGNPSVPPPGNLTVPTPPANITKIILNFNFGPGNTMSLSNWTLTGPDGLSGEKVSGACDVTGNPGHDAMRLKAVAANITVNNVTFNLGNGGTGGEAETSDDCDPGTAVGGPGGQAGNLKMVAAGSFDITGSFTINPGKGGNGGEGYAQGKHGAPGCAGEKGGDAHGTGGAGADNNKGLKTVNVSGLANVTLGAIHGGAGGEGTADAGAGGDGDGCGCDGGPGGHATAAGGNGGNATSRTVASFGGDAGDASFFPGYGGFGGTCGPDGPGGNGGRGGDVRTAVRATPGTGVTGNGQPGSSLFRAGGTGGNGGDGCTEGQGGKGGNGDPNGEDGVPGTNLCAPVNTNTGVAPPQEDVSLEQGTFSFIYDHQNPQCPLSIGMLTVRNAPAGSYFNIQNTQNNGTPPVWLNFPQGEPYDGGVQGVVNGGFPLEFPCQLESYTNQEQQFVGDVLIFDPLGKIIAQDQVQVNGTFSGF